MELPQEYRNRMQEMLGTEFPDYLASLTEERTRSLRINTGKWTLAQAQENLGDLLTDPVPWVPEGWYYQNDARPAVWPQYAAGLYYLQEASAMTPGSVLPLREGTGLRVLDLCAAPGGKATQLAARLGARGVLYANDISASRAQTLLKNLERAGAARIFVTAEQPDRLALSYPDYFDSVLVDAPCSGEGMIRKDAGILHDWVQRGPAYYQPLQREILESAASMTAAGGGLLYSTCTFSWEENEGNIEDFLRHHPEFALEDIPMRPGFSAGFLSGTVRLWPQRVHAEGHFLALMRKAGQVDRRISVIKAIDQTVSSEVPGKKRKHSGRNTGRIRKQEQRGVVLQIPEEYTSILPDGVPYALDNRVYLLPEGEQPRAGLRYLRTGLLLGEDRHGRFVPSQALAMAASRGSFPSRVDLKQDDTMRYLKGETVRPQEAFMTGTDGIVLVTWNEFPLGWARRQNGSLRNMLNPAWRLQ